MAERFGRDFWEERYRGHTAVWSGRPNAPLVVEVAELATGTALDAGCGEGADAVWLAERGWRVTAVDFAGPALERARAHAATLGADVAARIDWLQADLGTWVPEGRFELVTTHYLHVPRLREAVLPRLAAAVTPGGALLVVGHHPDDPSLTERLAETPELFVTAEELAQDLDPDAWEVVAADARPRTAVHHGQEIEHLDTVLHARRRGA